MHLIVLVALSSDVRGVLEVLLYNTSDIHYWCESVLEVPILMLVAVSCCGMGVVQRALMMLVLFTHGKWR